MDISYKIQQLSYILEKNLVLWTPCGEYELLEKLREQANLAFLSSEPGNTHHLFQSHFLLFHVLYHLRDKWWNEQLLHLDISPLNIECLPYQEGEQKLTESDPLRDYYLDLLHLETTNQNDVDELIGRFWLSMHHNEHRDDALAVLGLSDPVDDKTIKATYQKLVMQHHPDRGGDDVKLQELNLAMEMLRKK